MSNVQPKPSGYLIPVGKTDDERLSALGAIYNPFSLKLLQSHITSEKPSILDVGCGNGELTILFAKTFPGADIVAIDNSQEQIDLAKKKAETENINISWEHSDVFKLADLESKYPKLFDVVHSRFVLSHAPNPTDAIAPMLSMVKPGGLLIIEEVGAKKTFKEPLPKAIRAWKKLVEVQFKLQQSHHDTIERIVKHLKNTPEVSFKTVLFNTTIRGQQQKSLFRLGFEHGRKILAGLEQSGKIKMLGYDTAKELISYMGYDDAEVWQKDLLEFENDDNATIELEDIESIVAVKAEAISAETN